MTTSRVVVTGGFFFYKRIEGAGHWMMRDASAKVNAALADFVAAGLDPDVSMYADLIGCTEEGMTTLRVVVTGGFFFYKRIEGAGHWMMRDASAKVNAALADFVAAGLDPDVSMYADLM
ncbi:hypothetical protein OEZ86_001212 [Tetradesmus obliquus]|nr:hypothetical protein OEZ86_001212 [Tetradesmus obliquus]